MIVTNYELPVMSSWMQLNGRRLDCNPYLSGAFEAKVRLERLRAKKQPLQEVTKGGIKGIFNGPRFSRNYVYDPKYGVPFLGSTDILAADFSTLSYLSKKQVASQPNLLIEEGWTLITCSGTIGRMAYAREEMSGMAGSQHFMRVVPDTNKIPPGYLFSYLSSEFGVPIITSATYGAIIQHIEPHHVADLPVPRLGSIELQSHELCVAAAQERTEASRKLQRTSEIINEHFNFPRKLAPSHRAFSTAVTASLSLRGRMEATFHDAVAQASDNILSKLARTMTLKELNVEVGELNRMKQNFVEEQHGIPFITSSEIFHLNFEPSRFLMRRLLPTDSITWLVRENDLLLARSGQVGGIIGRGAWADRRFAGSCVSPHVLRLRTADNIIRAGYLYAYLFLTDVGYRQLIRTAAGSSIPFLSASDIMSLRIPRTGLDIEGQIDDLVREAGELRASAQEKETTARKLVEEAIKGGRF